MTTSTGRALVLAGALGFAACVRTVGTLVAGPGGGPTPVNCAAEEAGLEFFPDPSSPRAIVNFETPGTLPGQYIGQYMYAYYDGTSFAHPEGTAVGVAAGYQPQAIPLSRCSGDPDPNPNPNPNHVLHITGGPFLGWGGGLGVAMQHLSQDEGLCLGSPLRQYCPPAIGDAVSIAALDLSQWDGVAVWARRGPNSQPLLRVLVGNKDTDDDISYLTDLSDRAHMNPRYCERVRECACTYQNLACAYADAGTPGAASDGGYYCGLPGAAPGPGIIPPISGSDAATNTCNVSRCNDPYPAFPADVTDVKFVGRPCTPYAFRNGLQSSYCFNPGVDPPPAESDQQCGDHWTAPLHLTTDWQLFKVPFTTMFQQGFGKRSPSFDLKSVSVVRLTWDAGSVDYWIDDLRFYRVRR